MANRPQQQHTLVHLHRSIFFLLLQRVSSCLASLLYAPSPPPPSIENHSSPLLLLLFFLKRNRCNKFLYPQFHLFFSIRRKGSRVRVPIYIFRPWEIFFASLSWHVRGKRGRNEEVKFFFGKEYYNSISYSTIFEWKIHLTPNEFSIQLNIES